MKIQTISLVAGEGQCPRHCPYCVSRMTGKAEFSNMPIDLSEKVARALRLAELSGVSTALITGKGEPLYGEKSLSHVSQYLSLLPKFHIPFVEIQTSGYGLDEKTVRELAVCGVTTVAISCVSDSLNRNRDVYGPEYEDPFEIANLIHKYGMMARLSCTMCAVYMESWESMSHLIQSCKISGIEQVSFVPVTIPAESKSEAAAKWARKNRISDAQLKKLYGQVRKAGTRLMTLMHGGEVYDVDGVSVCIRYCLTEDAETSALRQVIVYPNGETRYSWTSDAARLIRGDRI